MPVRHIKATCLYASPALITLVCIPLTDCLLQSNSHPFLHPGLLHRAHRQPPAKENGGGEDQAEASGVRGHVRRGRLLHLLPALRHRQGGAAGRQAAGFAGRGERGGSGLRQPHGFVIL